MEHISDKEVLQLYFSTRKAAYLGIIFKRYTKVLLGVAMKYVRDVHHAEDIVQQVFIKFIEKAHADIDNIGGWLYFITRNECLNFIKKKNDTYATDFSEHTNISDDNDEDLLALIRKEGHYNSLLRAMEQLKPEQRDALHLFYFKNMSYEDIAHHKNWSVNEVKSYIQNGKRNLKLKLEGLIH